MRFLVLFASVMIFAGSVTASAEPYDVRNWRAPAQGAAATRAQITQLQQDLRSPDSAVRLAAAADAVRNNDAARIAALVSEGAVTSDPALADMASRVLFQRRGHNLVPEPLEAMNAAEEEAYMLLAGQNWGLAIRPRFYDVDTGAFDGGAFGVVDGMISGARISIDSNACRGTMQRVSGSWGYEGVIRCAYNEHRVTKRMRVDLQ